MGPFGITKIMTGGYDKTGTKGSESVREGFPPDRQSELPPKRLLFAPKHRIS